MLHPDFVALDSGVRSYWLSRAQFEADVIAGRALTPTDYAHRFVTNDRGRYRLPNRPVIQVIEVKARVRGGSNPITGIVPPGEWWEVAASDCHLQVDGTLGLPWPGIWEGEIVYRSGWDLENPALESGRMLRQAIDDLAYALWQGSVEGTLGAAPQTFRVEGEYSVSYGANTVTMRQAAYDVAKRAIERIVVNA